MTDFNIFFIDIFNYLISINLIEFHSNIRSILLRYVFLVGFPQCIYIQLSFLIQKYHTCTTDNLNDISKIYIWTDWSTQLE